MTTKEYIGSGKLEMYVLGHLSEDENILISQLSREDSELNLEIKKIESAIIELTATVSPTLSSEMMDAIVSAQAPNRKAVESKKRTNWAAIVGWLCSLLLLLTAGYFGYENFGLTENQTKIQSEKARLITEIDSIKQSKMQSEKIIDLLRLATTQKFILESEDNSTDVSATLFYNHNELTAILDLDNLPVLGQGEVYQLWTITETEQKLLYTSIFIKEESKDDVSTLVVLDGITSNKFVLSIETAKDALEPSAIRFINKENQQ